MLRHSLFWLRVGRRERGRACVQRAQIGEHAGTGFRVADAHEGHLGSGHRPTGACEEMVEPLIRPVAGLALHGAGIGEARMRGNVAADDAPKVGPDAVRTIAIETVTGAADLRGLSALFDIACREPDAEIAFGW